MLKRKIPEMSTETYKTFKKKYKIKRTPIEKFADKITKTSGSFGFLAINILWFVGWIVVNLDLVPGITAFDPYPFGFLTLVVSLEAIVLTILVLISQNREGQINDLRGEIDASIDISAEEKISKVLEIIVNIAQKNDIDLTNDPELDVLLERTDKTALEDEMKAEVDEK